MTMVEGTALAFLKICAIAAVFIAVIMVLSRFLVARQRKRLEEERAAAGDDA